LFARNGGKNAHFELQSSNLIRKARLRASKINYLRVEGYGTFFPKSWAEGCCRLVFWPLLESYNKIDIVLLKTHHFTLKTSRILSSLLLRCTQSSLLRVNGPLRGSRLAQKVYAGGIMILGVVAAVMYVGGSFSSTEMSSDLNGRKLLSSGVEIIYFLYLH